MSRTRSLPIGLVAEIGLRARDENTWWAKYTSLKKNAAKRGLECSLSFKQYLKLAQRAGIVSPKEIGCTSNKYQMGRLGDTGNYVWGNCRFITMAENQKEKIINGGQDVGMLKRLSRIPKGGYANATKTFCILSPSGKQFIGDNLKEFCRSYGLGYNWMAATLRGSKSQYKGWTGSYI
jgi:hypothetical protein